MKKILRSVSLLLAFVFAVSLLAACDTVEQARESESAGSGGAAVVSIGAECVSGVLEETVSDVAESTISESPAVSEAAEGGFPDIYRDWCGMTVDILAASCGGHSLYEYGVSGLKDESHADAISTAFRQRAERIEREYGLVAEVTLTEGIGEAADTILQQHLAGLDDYQLVADGLFFLLQPNMAGVLQDFYEIGEGCLDLGADYWDQDAVRALTYDGRLTVLTGDAVASDDAATVVLYCNRDLLEKNELADPVELVEEGNWTVDALYEMCRQTATWVSDGFYMSFERKTAISGAWSAPLGLAAP